MLPKVTGGLETLNNDQRTCDNGGDLPGASRRHFRQGKLSQRQELFGIVDTKQHEQRGKNHKGHIQCPALQLFQGFQATEQTNNGDDGNDNGGQQAFVKRRIQLETCKSESRKDMDIQAHGDHVGGNQRKIGQPLGHDRNRAAASLQYGFGTKYIVTDDAADQEGDKRHHHHCRHGIGADGAGKNRYNHEEPAAEDGCQRGAHRWNDAFCRHVTGT